MHREVYAQGSICTGKYMHREVYVQRSMCIGKYMCNLKSTGENRIQGVMAEYKAESRHSEKEQ